MLLGQLYSSLVHRLGIFTYGVLIIIFLLTSLHRTFKRDKIPSGTESYGLDNLGQTTNTV